MARTNTTMTVRASTKRSGVLSATLGSSQGKRRSWRVEGGFGSSRQTQKQPYATTKRTHAQPFPKVARRDKGGWPTFA
jgi:hypothetical protein